MGIVIMNKLVWSPAMELGIPEIDRMHRSFFMKLSDMPGAPELEFELRFYSLLADLEKAFLAEEKLMASIRFYAAQSHREEHAKLLKALHNAIPDVMRGESGSALKVLEVLPKWFLHHLSTMDSFLSAWFKLKNGGVALEPYLSMELNPASGSVKLPV